MCRRTSCSPKAWVDCHLAKEGGSKVQVLWNLRRPWGEPTGSPLERPPLTPVDKADRRRCAPALDADGAIFRRSGSTVHRRALAAKCRRRAVRGALRMGKVRTEGDFISCAL